MPKVNYRYDKAKAETQANKAMGVIEKAGLIKSVGTNRNYRECLQHTAQWIKDNRLGDLRHMDRDTATRYLDEMKNVYSQKTLDMHRQAIQAHFHATGVLQSKETLPVTKSEVQTVLEHRAYTPAQVSLVAQSQNERNAFSTELAYAAGLRAHELLTIRPLAEQPADIRRYEDGSIKALDTKWQGREEGVPYSVIGKGGLVREVRLPQELADKLESRRLEEPIQVRDRGVNYEQHYDVAGGQKWSNSFSAASERVLGWSTGAHGLRHSYAQERLHELERFCPYEKALETVSQEMGHFRPEITETYLR